MKKKFFFKRFSSATSIIARRENERRSTLTMAKSFHKIEWIVKDAHQSMNCEQDASENTLIESLSPAEMVLLEGLIQIIQVLDDITLLLGKSTATPI